MLKFDFIQTLAIAGVVLFIGYAIKRRVSFLHRYNIPAPVVGGLVFALLGLLLRQQGFVVEFDTLLQTPLMIAFFTTIGFGASLSLLRVGGRLVLIFFTIASAVCVLQNLLGLLIATALGEHPLLGVLAGSTTMAGGPATGLAFAPEFETAGVSAAAPAAVAAAMVGIMAGGLIGGPIATSLLARHRISTGSKSTSGVPGPSAEDIVEAQMGEAASKPPTGEDANAYRLLKNITLILVAMWLGGLLSAWLSRYVTLPAYIGAMIVAAVIRNVDDLTGWFGPSQRTIDDLGTVVLSLFLAMALMTLQLWQLAGLAVPLTIILIAQVALIAAIGAILIYRVMGRDYDAAVMSSGFCGFMLGTTANAMANMEAITERYGAAPKAFLVVPMVGAFFIDFTNALIITTFLNFWRPV